MNFDDSSSAPFCSPPVALIDWLSVSVIPPEGSGLDWTANVLSTVFGIGRDCWQVTGSGWFGYRQRINLGEWGLLAHGGERQRGTVHFELNAHACARISDWQAVRDWGESTDARITRVDLAHDDFSGESVNIPQMLAWNNEGSFSNGGDLRKRDWSMTSDRARAGRSMSASGSTGSCYAVTRRASNSASLTTHGSA